MRWSECSEKRVHISVELMERLIGRRGRLIIENREPITVDLNDHRNFGRQDLDGKFYPHKLKWNITQKEGLKRRGRRLWRDEWKI